MDSVKLKISINDWVYICIVALFFGFFISLIFFFLNKQLQDISTIIFTTTTAILVAFFAFVLITVSNDYILPKTKESFWYPISFLFSFLSGFLGFYFSFYIFSLTNSNIIEMVRPYVLNISAIIGFITFLIGLILHQFISMKYRSESIKSEFLETKIKALENELNPHFLFNALNSISELIHLDKDKAESVTLKLSTFLRNAIVTDSLITLSSELNMVNTYLYIENIRFQNRIKLKTNIDESLKDTLVPKFSIQLLVENAIKHGYNGKDLNIEVKAKYNKIKVSNDGLLPQKQLKFGTGLNNLKKRLDLMQIGELSYEIEDDKINFIINL